MKTTFSADIRSFLRSTLLAVFFLYSSSACDSGGEPITGSETHFLQTCTNSCSDSELSCVCGVCTASCESNAQCSGLGQNTICRSAPGTCNDPQPPASICDVECASNADCAALSSAHVCMAGVCRAPASTPDSDVVDDGTPSCNTGETLCNATCVDLNADAEHCGACNQACSSGQVCNNGVCASATCTSDSDCSAGQLCINGACMVGGPCGSGFSDCDGDPANGCEVRLDADPNHCGACGQACPAGQSCVGGVCTL